MTRTDKKGDIEVLADKWEGKRLNAPNDIVVSKNGHVYFTDPAFGSQADTRELDFYGVYHIAPKGELRLIAKPAGRPNGIALSPNGRILYVDQFRRAQMRAYNVDRNGEASGERVIVSDIEGVPDGIRTDEKGNLYVAAKGIAVYIRKASCCDNHPLRGDALQLRFRRLRLADPVHHRADVAVSRAAGRERGGAVLGVATRGRPPLSAATHPGRGRADFRPRPNPAGGARQRTAEGLLVAARRRARNGRNAGRRGRREVREETGLEVEPLARARNLRAHHARPRRARPNTTTC